MARLHHMGITVSNTDETVRFYRALTEVSVEGPFVKSGPAIDATVGVEGAEIWITFVAFEDGDAVIELAEYRGNTEEPLDPVNSRVAATHPAILVPDMDDTIARLATRGYHATAAPAVATSGPIEGFRYVYVIGPDALRVELLEAPGSPKR